MVLHQKMLLIKKLFPFFSLFLLLLGVFFFTVRQDEEVIFTDANFELAIREILEHSGKPIFKSQLLGIVELNLQNKDIYSLNGIEYFRNLEILNLSKNVIDDVGALQTLYNLRVLDLSHNRLVDLEKANFQLIAILPLISLNLENNHLVSETDQIETLSSIKVLKTFDSLQELNLANNQIRDLYYLSRLKNLRSLNLSGNQITEIEFLEDLVQLRKLNLRNNKIEDLSPIKDLVNLTYLNLHTNEDIISIKPIQAMVNLETLILRNVPVGNEIKYLSKLNRLNRLNLRNCSLWDISVLYLLMENGALQDVPESGVKAYLDILENNFDQNPEMLKAFLPYWDNIHTKYPQALNFATLTPPLISRSAGFNSEPFYIEIQSEIESARIYYTLDGSIPTRGSNQYHEPVLIGAETSGEEEFPKGVTLRAILFSDEFEEVSSVVTQSFFIGEQVEFSSSLPIVSMTVDPDFLFHREFGLYTGRNYLYRGMKWERSAHIEFFEITGVLGFSKNVNIRIHGVESRQLPQKSFRIYANSIHEEEKIISYELFSDYKNKYFGEPVNEFETLLLRNSGTELFRTMFRDAFVQTLAEKTNLDTQAYRPVNLYINGEYWGLYNFRERIDEFYVRNHYYIDPDDVAIIEYVANVGLVGDQRAVNKYLQLYSFISDNDITNEEIYRKVGEMMDLENFIDYQIIQIYSANMDWPQNNNVFWRLISRTGNPEAYEGFDIRWRWILFDLDFAFHNSSLDLMSFATRDDQSTFLLRSLIKNDEFRHQFLNRFADLMNTTFSPQYVINRIEEMQFIIEPDISRHIARWSLPESLDSWYANIQNKKDFATNRPSVMRKHLVDFFNLEGFYEITISTNSEEGYVNFNSINIFDGTPGVVDASLWVGKYIINIPVQIIAEPLPGYKFVRWEFSSGESFYERVMTINFDADVSIYAIFEPIDE